MQESLQIHFDKIESQRAWFIEQQAKIPAEYITKGPKEDEWSLTQVIEHLVITEQLLVSAIENASRIKPPASVEETRQWRVVKVILKSGTKVPVPTERVEPKSVESIESLLGAWEAIRTNLKQILGTKTETNLLVFTHPTAGPLDIAETLEFLSLHLQYHTIRAQKEFGHLSNS
jgi:glucose/arabinose dehydrogenase